jgi:AraC-like DNA-binding protein
VYFITCDSQMFDFKSGGKCSLLSISFRSDLLEPLHSRFQIMTTFLEKARAGLPCALFKNPQSLTAENKRLLNDIFSDTWNDDHIRHMIRLILLPSLKMVNTNTSAINEHFPSIENSVYSVAEWLLLHPDEPISIPALAQKFLMNEFKLKTDFKKHFGVPVIAFQRKARIERAKQLLKQPNVPISEIAKATGFIYTAYFSDFFRRETGVSPSGYRKILSVTGTVSSGNRA